MNPLLIAHIALGVVLVAAFVGRYVGVLTKRIEPKTGRLWIAALATALVASGTALGIVYKAPITKDCISSLAIIGTVVALEYVLQYVASKPLPTK
jgi:hypothetical protein